MNRFSCFFPFYGRRFGVIFFGLFFFMGGPMTIGLSGKTSTWKDMQGVTFRGEPMEVIGPWALFKTGSLHGKQVLLRGFPPEEIRRFQAEIALRPTRSDSWATAHGAVTSELVGHVLRVKNKELVPANLASIPEPQVLLVLFGSHSDSESWQMLAGPLAAVYARTQRVYPGLFDAVFVGIRHSAIEHRQMAIDVGMPWLVANFADEVDMVHLTRFIPGEGTNMVLLSREGVPLLAARASDTAAMRSFVDKLSDLLWQMDPSNPRTWQDRLAYLAAIRPVEFAQSYAAPLLVGDPLRAEALRKYGVTRVKARLAVAANGNVTAAIHSTAAELPPELAEPLAQALSQAVVSPAIDHGAAVAGTLDYDLPIPPENRQAEVDAKWIQTSAYPVLPISDWLVLSPIKVPEQDFTSTVEGETPDGMVVFKALQVSNEKVSRAAQMNAFNSDWFTAAGAASVQPKPGEKQSVDGKELTWRHVKANDGYVDLRRGIGNQDYTVGYAWTEFEVPADTPAWLGLGSDDGVKIWLNGELIHDKWIRRPSRIDDDVVPLQLKRGRNRLLLKIQNATVEWSFLYRIRTEPK
ncbi:MAG: hypothetical protein ABI273_16180 [Lacunisphaera sp.]